MKDLLNKIFTLGGFLFTIVLFIALAVMLGAPVPSTTGWGVALFVVMVAFALWAVKKYNSTPKP